MFGPAKKFIYDLGACGAALIAVPLAITGAVFGTIGGAIKTAVCPIRVDNERISAVQNSSGLCHCLNWRQAELQARYNRDDECGHTSNLENGALAGTLAAAGGFLLLYGAVKCKKWIKPEGNPIDSSPVVATEDPERKEEAGVTLVSLRATNPSGS